MFFPGETVSHGFIIPFLPEDIEARLPTLPPWMDSTGEPAGLQLEDVPSLCQYPPVHRRGLCGGRAALRALQARMAGRRHRTPLRGLLGRLRLYRDEPRPSGQHSYDGR